MTRILIVEDEIIVAMFMEDILAELGYEVAGVVSHLDEAMKRERDFDVAVLDVHLNGRNVFDFADKLTAEMVPFIFATGYGSMNGWAAKLISQDVADRVGKCWGLGSNTTYDPGPWEGELRNMWKPTAQPGLWFQGGNLMQARFFSLPLALQLKARYEGLDTPVYS